MGKWQQGFALWKTDIQLKSNEGSAYTTLYYEKKKKKEGEWIKLCISLIWYI